MRWVWWMMLVGSGCTGGGGTADTGQTGACGRPGQRTLEVGVGFTRFEPLASEGAFPLVHGPQGGYHLEIGLRAHHFAAEGLLLGHLTGVIDGTVYAESAPWVDLRCLNDQQDAWGFLLIYEAEPEFLDGKITTVTAELKDSDGTVVRTEARFTIDDSANQ